MRRRGLHLAIVAAAVMVFLSACKPQVPPEYLQPDEMEDLMYDYYVSQGISNSRAGTTDYDRRYNMQTVLKKYGLTNDDFDSTLVYYYNHMELMNEIYSRIQKRLGDEAILLGASEGEVERFTTQSVSGDTTDVWEGKRQLTLMPIPPYHIVQFSQKADTSFYKGDSFLLTFGSRFLAQRQRGDRLYTHQYHRRLYTPYACLQSEGQASGWLFLYVAPRCDRQRERGLHPVAQPYPVDAFPPQGDC